VAIDKTTGKLLKAGTDAQKMLGRTPGNIVALRPLSEGVISDYEMTERMIKEFLRKVSGFRMFKPRIVICVPSGITEVEERAVIDAGLQAGARRVYLIEEPVAAAIGAGIDISRPCGHMIVDIGGGTTDVAVISLKGIVESTSIKIAGDQFDEAIVKYIRRKHNVLIGERTAEELKVNIGCVFPRPEEKTIEAKGRCLMTGLPKSFTVSSTDMIDALEEVSTRIIEAIHSVLERTPPELVADISTGGIIMTGGGSLVWGFDKLIEAKTGIATHVADEAISCVVYGTGKSLDMINDMQDGTMNLSRRRQMGS
jgi:rod shape-determining protein MreB